jgi:hypothetical protein
MKSTEYMEEVLPLGLSPIKIATGSPLKIKTGRQLTIVKEKEGEDSKNPTTGKKRKITKNFRKLL